MRGVRDLLIEIGTEELPPTSLMKLANAFADGVSSGLKTAGVSPTSQRVFATPRRLAVQFEGIAEKQPDSESERRGPALSAALNDDGVPTKAAEGFARSCGVAVDQLQQQETAKGTWLVYTVKQVGQPTIELLGSIVQESLARLPIPKRMRWGDNDAEFVRPVHWLCALFGQEQAAIDVYGITASQHTRGHRFHENRSIEIKDASDYAETLLQNGKVVADFAQRRQMIVQQIEESVARLDGSAVMDDALLDEVTALVEWPVAIVGGFDNKYLSLPEEVLITTMQTNQKYFPVRDRGGKLMPSFVTIANIESSCPESVQFGNERVIRPRLEDAMFFWDQDRKRPLSSSADRLTSVLFQKQLGSVAEKTARVASLAGWICDQLNFDDASAQRAGVLAKCDLLTEMVGEFPSLQGVMGEYYARHDGEPESVAVAIREQYLPRFASDALPTSDAGRVLAIADRIDTLVGIFAIGQKPTGVKDPFALRRAALAVLRILIECGLPLDLRKLLIHAAQGFDQAINAEDSVDALFDFAMERLKAYYGDQSISPQIFEAVLGTEISEPLDFDRRIHAVAAFEALSEAESLAAANKRISNILKKAGSVIHKPVDPGSLIEAPEKALFTQLGEVSVRAEPLFANGDYRAYLQALAVLKETVDEFFDGVMVMADDGDIRSNRLALLSELSTLFGRVADISHLSNT